MESMAANESVVENAMLKDAEHTVVESDSKEKKLNNSLQVRPKFAVSLFSNFGGFH